MITGSPSVLTEYRGVSAAAWQIQPPGVDENGLGHIGVGGVEVSATDESNESEAALLALNAALRLMEDGTTVRLFTYQTWTVIGVNGGGKRWEEENWKDRTNKVLWQEFLQICSGKALSVEGEHAPAADRRFVGDFRILRKRARTARDQRCRELGTPTSGFDEA